MNTNVVELMDESSCAHERSHITDSKFHGGCYAKIASRRIFCDECRLQRWLNVEVALAQAQGELGIIPLPVAHEIARAARLENIDLREVAQGIRQTGHSLVPLLRGLQRACADGAGEYVHYGATTQDIQDTGQALEMREVLDATERLVGSLIEKLTAFVRDTRDHIIVGRTHSVPALPTTFGLKVASWLDELLRHEERWPGLRERLLVVQLFGGVGTMAAFGPKAIPLLELFARKLHLGVPSLGWHVARDRVAEFVFTMAMLGATLARIADEIRTLCRVEIGEIELPWTAHQIGSSTMPHKRNPEVYEQIVVLARLARSHVATALEAMVVEHERDYRGTRLEWPAVADVSHYVLAALTMLEADISAVKVNPEQMRRNVEDVYDMIGSEAITFELAESMGKESAYRLIYELSQKSQDRRQPFAETLRNNDTVVRLLGADRLADLLRPEKHIGAAGALVDRVLERVKRRRPAPAELLSDPPAPFPHRRAAGRGER